MELVMVAVIQQGGRQFRVAEGDTIVVDRLAAEVGATVEVDRILLVGIGADAKVGSPIVEGAKVTAEVVAHQRGHKRLTYKYRRTRRYRRIRGGRPEETTLKITSIAP
jgi:large subunit ribosomal protein L21